MAGVNIVSKQVTQVVTWKTNLLNNDILKLTQILWQVSLQWEANPLGFRQQGNY